MLGFEENEIGNTPEEWFARVHPKDIEHLKTKITAHLEGHVHHFQDEHRMLHKDGTYRWMFGRGLAVRNPEGQASRMAGSLTDITERKAAEKQLLHDAFHDALTGLPNRALFMDRLGLSMGRTDHARPEDFLCDADAAMYRAKAQGKARYEIFDSDMHVRAVTLLQLESDLRRAIDHHQLSIHYQPIISLQTGRITGAEALLRWQHPQRGFVSPVEFIPLAEETGLIRPVGEWVLQAACAQAMAWQADGYPGLRVTVNFSSRQFEYENIQDLIKKVLKETRLPPQTLELEITEGMAIREGELGARALNELRAIHIRISIDDFGIGSSSLAYLKRLPIATLKIDRSFVRDLATDPDDASITSAIIAMAHSLKLNVVAEGVETEEQLAFLRSQQCDEMQGYLFSPPVQAEAFSKLLREGHS